jgi:hypothetical protein
MLALSQPIEDALGDSGIEQTLATADRQDGPNQVGALDLLQDIAGGAGHDRGEERLVVGEGSEHQDLRVWQTRTDLPGGLDSAPVRQANVHDDHVGPGPLHADDGVFDVPGLPDDAHIRGLLEQGFDPVADDFMIIDQDHPKGHRAQDHPIFAKSGAETVRTGPARWGTIVPWPAERRLYRGDIFIRYYVELAHPRAALEKALLSAPDSLIPSIATFADDRGQHLLVEVGFPVDGRRLSKNVEIDVGKPVASADRTWIPIAWRATGPSGLFPVLDAELEFASLGSELTQLSLSGRYQPPLGLVGRTIDKALLSRVAEATIKDFVDRLARAIEAAVTPAA